MTGCELVKCGDYKDKLCHYPSEFCKYQKDLDTESQEALDQVYSEQAESKQEPTE